MKNVLLLSALFCCIIDCVAQPGINDPTFNPTDVGFGVGDSFDKTVYKVLVQPDGKILAAGYFSKFNGTIRESIARLNTDGTLDTLFNPNGQIEGGMSIHDLALQPDGKIIAVGYFTQVNNVAGGKNIIRFEADGGIDNSFDIGEGFEDGVTDVILQPDGKIIVGGAFQSYNNIPCQRIARLNSNGSFDATFHTGLGFEGNYGPYDIVLQPDGKIIVGGRFTAFNGASCNNIVRINTDGSLDASFVSGTGFDDDVNALVLQANGNIISGGEFHEYNGDSIASIVRLNSTGSIDTTFQFDPDFPYDLSEMVFSDTNENLIALFKIPSFSTTSFKKINNNGTFDTLLNIISPSYQVAISLAVQQDGKIITGGDFFLVNGVNNRNIIRLLPNGTPDESFIHTSGFNHKLTVMQIQPDDKIIVGGAVLGNNSAVNLFNGEKTKGLIRLNDDGSLDTTFIQLNEVPASILLTSEGKIVYLHYSGIDRLNTNGTPDTTIEYVGFGNTPKSMDIQPDGKIIVVGPFVTSDNEPRWSIARINLDGSLDESYTASAETGVTTVVVQPDNRAVIGGRFTRCNTSDRINIARYNPDGSTDESFNSSLDEHDWVMGIALQSDNKIIINVWNYNIGYYRLLRLNQDGTMDPTFYADFDSVVTAIKIHPSGQILVGGEFTHCNGVAKNRIALLNEDGSVDDWFITGSGCDDIVNGFGFQSTGKIIIAGEFLSYNGIGRNRIARLNGDAVGVEETGPNEPLKIYPNPATNTITIQQLAGNHFSFVKIINALGEVVYDGSIINQQSTISIAEFSSGIYFLSLSNGKQTVNAKFIKE